MLLCLKCCLCMLLFVVFIFMLGIGMYVVVVQEVLLQVNCEQVFFVENDVVMIKMMDGMVLKFSGNIDQDFVVMMMLYYQGVIDMVVVYLCYG